MLRNPASRSQLRALIAASTAFRDELETAARVRFGGGSGVGLPADSAGEGPAPAERPWELVARFANAQMRGDLAMAHLLNHPDCAAPQQRADLREICP